MLFQDAPINTSGYMVAGYIIAFAVMGLYVLSLISRWRNLQKDLTTLEELDHQ